jgi:hypothetical protein
VPAGHRQRDRHRRVEVRPGQGRGDIDAQRDRHRPAPRGGPDVGEPRGTRRTPQRRRDPDAETENTQQEAPDHLTDDDRLRGRLRG